jgi:DNA polymerase-3 subunit gamma/tau
MVTPQGFNALLKLVEEPPEHVKFIFATTEPEKVIGTIRSRTHHYPFRLVPPAQMLDYVQHLCGEEGIEVEGGVLPLVVRAGGGSVRDTLSLLDQLIAGSEGSTVRYERAVALLGYTHGALLDEIVDALAARDAQGVFAGVDRVIQTGQDPRRFVDDLLERLRDLIVVAATRDEAAAVLRGVPADEIERMQHQAASYGTVELSRAADVVNSSLTEMTGATSPRLHLELMAARLLVPASDESERGTLARVERLERRIGIEGSDAAPSAAAPAERPAAAAPVARPAAPRAERPAAPAAEPGVAPAAEPAQVVDERRSEGSTRLETTATAPEPQPEAPTAVTADGAAAAAEAGHGARSEEEPPPRAAGAVTLQQLRDAWPEILEIVQGIKRGSWMVVYTSTPRAYDGSNEVLTLSFPSDNDVQSFRQAQGAGDSVSEHLRQAILQVLGVRVKFIARVEGAAASAPAAAPAAAPASATDAPPAPAAGGWNVTPIPGGSTASADEPTPIGAAVTTPSPAAVPDDEVPPPSDDDAPPPDDEPEPPAETASREARPAPKAKPAAARPATDPPAATPPASKTQPAAQAERPRSASNPNRPGRYGEAVVREVLKASFIEEVALSPSDRPVRLVEEPEPAAAQPADSDGGA